MSDLGPEARSILGAGRNGDDPTPTDRARVRRNLARAIAAGGAAAAASAAGTAAEGSAAAATAIAGKTATLLMLGKIGGGLVFVAALGAGIWFSRPLPPGPAPSASVPVTDSASPITAPPPAPSAAPDSPSPESPPADPPAAAAPEAPAPASPGQAAVSARPSASAGEAPPRDPLVDETQELREAHGALQSGDPQKALKLLDEQATTYAGGQLREEREAARVLALCKLGKKDEARAKIADFLRDHPGSPLEGRVRSGCPATPSP